MKKINEIEYNTKPYESFLYFLAFLFISRLLPIFQVFLTNLFLQLIFVLVIVFLLTNLINNKVTNNFKNFCLRFNFKLPYLYVVSIVLYIIAFLSFGG
ncbi:hypothetical protein CIL03_18625 [Virgibacillus indicus]|uniref:Uncharacterized protein n=1 Tax=Virgibacillus indicus TaxID=2024554 RepID=A0A265N6S2_9BACI|nr:hypothetical protein CIL03_18625 [Virgibacillus indicus]